MWVIPMAYFEYTHAIEIAWVVVIAISLTASTLAP